MTSKKLILNVWKKNTEMVCAMQGEVDSRFLTISLIDGDGPINLKDKTVKFQAKKPDETVIFNTATIIDAVNGIVQVGLTSQMSAVAGMLKDCEIVIMDKNNNSLIASGINIYIMPSLGDAVEESLSESTAYQELINTLQDHLSNVNNPHKVSAEQIGESTAYQELANTLQNHLSNVNNPHNVSAEQIGESTAYQELASTLQNHLSNVNNPHNVSAEQIGESTAYQELANTLQNHLSNENNPHNVSAEQISDFAYIQSDWNQNIDTADDYIKNKPIIPNKISDLNDDTIISPIDKAKYAATSGGLTDGTYNLSIPNLSSDDTIAKISDIPTSLSSLNGTLPIAKGGTGATNADDALTNLGTIPVYTSPTEFISYPCTTSQLIQAMPYPAILIANVESLESSVTDLPCPYGLLNIHKKTQNRMQIIFNRSHQGVINGNSLYFGNFNTLSKSVIWNKIFTNYSGCQIPIENGGTGAATASSALTTLGAAKSSDVGNVGNLSTNSKTIVGAINELFNSIKNL